MINLSFYLFSGATPPAACEPPQPILNGFVEAVAAGVGAGSQIEYRCKGGFYLVGNEIRTCQKDGTWNGTEPTCDEGENSKCSLAEKHRTPAEHMNVT